MKPTLSGGPFAPPIWISTLKRGTKKTERTSMKLNGIEDVRFTKSDSRCLLARLFDRHYC